MRYFYSIFATLCVLASPLLAHDSWVQTNTNIIRAGDAVHIDLMLGNHGNGHRDFKLAGKLDVAAATLQVVAPDGQKFDLKTRLKDLGYSPEEGFWSTKFVASRPGLYTVAHTMDSVASYAPVRNIKSAKTCFVASKSMDRVPIKNPGFERRWNHALELVPDSNPVTPMGPDTPLAIRLYFKGKPLAKTKVSFIPRGANLKPGFDASYERTTNANGRVSFTPKEANYYLIVAHHETPEKGKGYDSTKYAAALTVYVPQICPCCG